MQLDSAHVLGTSGIGISVGVSGWRSVGGVCLFVRTL